MLSSKIDISSMDMNQMKPQNMYLMHTQIHVFKNQMPGEILSDHVFCCSNKLRTTIPHS